MNNKRYIEKIPLKFFFNQEWLLDIYVIKYDRNEIIDDKLLFGIISNCLIVLNKQCLSKEFEYFKTGIAFLHFGRRGIDLSIWHIGVWGNTYEYFSCTWYCYQRDYWNMELLDNAEPKISQYEIDLLGKELKSINSLLESNPSVSDFRCLFIHR